MSVTENVMFDFISPNEMVRLKIPINQFNHLLWHIAVNRKTFQRNFALIECECVPKLEIVWFVNKM